MSTNRNNPVDDLRAALTADGSAEGARLAGRITGAAGAVVAYATRAGLAARRDVVEVLHLTGAEDAQIANLFELRFAAPRALASKSATTSNSTCTTGTTIICAIRSPGAIVNG